jgi:hypothetical protein
MPSGVGFQVMPSSTDWLPRDFFPSAGQAPSAMSSSMLRLFTSAPDAGGGIEGQLFFPGLAVSALLGRACGDDHAFVVLDLHFLELPDEPFALAVAGFVFEQEDVVLGGGDAGAAVVVRVLASCYRPASTGTAEVFGSGGRKARTCSTVPSGMSRRSAGAP